MSQGVDSYPHPLLLTTSIDGVTRLWATSYSTASLGDVVIQKNTPSTPLDVHFFLSAVVESTVHDIDYLSYGEKDGGGLVEQSEVQTEEKERVALCWLLDPPTQFCKVDLSSSSASNTPSSSSSSSCLSGRCATKPFSTGVTESWVLQVHRDCVTIYQVLRTHSASSPTSSLWKRLALSNATTSDENLVDTSMRMSLPSYALLNKEVSPVLFAYALGEEYDADGKPRRIRLFCVNELSVECWGLFFHGHGRVSTRLLARSAGSRSSITTLSALHSHSLTLSINKDMHATIWKTCDTRVVTLLVYGVDIWEIYV